MIPGGVVDDRIEERHECLKQCINDQQLPLDVRVAGALIALYGPTITRIIRLTHADIQTRGGDVYIKIDRSPLLLPPRLAEIIGRLAETARLPAAIGRSIQRTAWLLRGRQPGQHVSASFLGRKLVQCGIQARPTRNAAVLAVAENLPAAVLADLLGMHVTTAERWAKIASRDWAHYITARATERPVADPAG